MGLFVRKSQLDRLEAALQACADAETVDEACAADHTYQAAIRSSRAEELKKFQNGRAKNVKFRDE